MISDIENGIALCPSCRSKSVKNGHMSGKQRYRCASCKRSFMIAYRYPACERNMDADIASLVREGCGIRSIARLLDIGPATVVRRIRRIAEDLGPPSVEDGGEYEIDELHTYVGQKENPQWIIYALDRDTKNVTAFTVGNRTKDRLELVTDAVLASDPVKIHTDGLPGYSFLIPQDLHRSRPYGTNHIERKNVNIRTHVKRLTRRTICYSKRDDMLVACLKIYFWYGIARIIRTVPVLASTSLDTACICP